MWATIAVAGIVAIVAASLLATYLKSYRSVRATFTLGLAVFAGFFVAQAVYLVVSIWEMVPFLEGPVAPFLLGAGLLEAAGLSTLLYLTRK
jgi:hypothetical protein